MQGHGQKRERGKRPVKIVPDIQRMRKYCTNTSMQSFVTVI